MTAVSDETGREQAFERFPKLAGWIERLAGTQMDLSLKEWGEFLAELNVALSAAPVGEPALRMCGYCKTWNSKPCGEQCYLQPSDPVWTAPVAQEPVAWVRDWIDDGEEKTDVCDKRDPGAYPVYRSIPPATPAGLGADKLRELASCLDRALGDTDPSISSDYTDDEIKRDYPVFWVCQQLNAILALLSRGAGLDQQRPHEEQSTQNI